jgi:hypothetical protein
MDECDSLGQMFTNSKACADVKKEVEKALECQFKDRCETVKLAVRSSAAGEAN